jgi:WD40 repeat protein
MICCSCICLYLYLLLLCIKCDNQLCQTASQSWSPQVYSSMKRLNPLPPERALVYPLSKPDSDSVCSVAFMPNGKGLVSGLLDKTLKYWELNTAASNARKANEHFGKCVLDFTGHKGYVLSVAILHDGQWAVPGPGPKDHGVQFWDKHGRAQLMLQGHKNSGNVSIPTYLSM